MMLHAKFQNHRPSGPGEEDFKGFLLFIAMAAKVTKHKHVIR